MTCLLAYKYQVRLSNALGVSQLSDESLDTSLLSVDNHLGENSGVRSSAGRTTDPPLRSSEMRGVDDKFVCSWVESSGSFKTGYVGTVGQLGHCETADDTVQAKNTAVDPVACEVSGKYVGALRSEARKFKYRIGT